MIHHENSASLAKMLKKTREEVIKKWCVRVLADPGVPRANELDGPLLRDHIPDFLDELIAGLENLEENLALAHADRASTDIAAEYVGQSPSAKEHAQTRSWQGYAAPEAIRELANLRLVIMETCITSHTPVLGVRLFHAAIDRAMATVAGEIAAVGRFEHGARYASDQQLQIVTQNLREYAVFMIDSNLLVSSWNKGAERIFGYSESEILNQPASLIFTPEDIEREIPALERKEALTRGSAESKRWHVKKNKTRFWSDGTLVPIHNEIGELLGFAKILRDETDRKKFEEDREALVLQLQEKAKELVDASKEKDDFLATLSHELRNPLGVIIGYADILRDDDKDPTLMDEAIELIYRNGQVALQLVSDLLDIARISSGKLSVEVRSIQLDIPIHGALAIVKLAAREKGVTINSSLPADLGRVMADPGRMQQVAWNLLTNAIKFTTPGGEINVKLSRIDGEIVFSVSDNGKGIAPEFLPYVFEKFKQEHLDAVRLQGGLGLGMAIVKQLVELHGGTVAALSEGIGKGATFIVTLPIID